MKMRLELFNVAGKPLPFRKKLPKVDNATYGTIIKALSKAGRKAYIIDDSQYLLAFEFFNRAKELGYQKFTDIALNFTNLIQYVIKNTSSDTIVYFLHHTEESAEGKLKAKTVGKMLDEKLTIEGLFTIVLLSAIEGTEYLFITNSDGNSTAKSPMEMFPLKIENDLKAVDKTIREYYGFKPLRKEERND